MLAAGFERPFWRGRPSIGDLAPLAIAHFAVSPPNGAR
jgi:hypothetical protein